MSQSEGDLSYTPSEDRMSGEDDKMTALIPWLMAVGVAVLSKLSGEREKQKGKERSIEFCVANCSAAWLKEDGVLRVYAEQGEMSCQRITVECSDIPNGIPGEVDGWPVRIRVNERMGQEETNEQKAARLFAQVATEEGARLKPVHARDGKLHAIWNDPKSRTATLNIEGASLSPNLETQMKWIGELNGARVSKNIDMGNEQEGPSTWVRFMR